MKKIIAIAAGVALAFSMAGCSASTATGTNDSDKIVTDDQNKTAPTVGDTLDAGDGVTITLNSVSYATEDSLGSAPDKGHFLVADYTIENASGEDLSISTLLCFGVAGDSGVDYTMSIFGPYDNSLDSTVKDGRKLTGQISFDVADETLYYLTFKPTLMADDVEFQVTPDQIG